MSQLITDDETLPPFFVAELGNSATDIIGRWSGQKNAYGYKYHFIIINIDNDAAAETIIAVYYVIEQCLTNGFLWIVRVLFSLQAFKVATVLLQSIISSKLKQ